MLGVMIRKGTSTLHKQRSSCGKRIICLLLVILLSNVLFSGCGQPTKVQSKPYIAVITKSLDSKFWESVYDGVNTAANEYGVEFTFEGSANEEDYEMQNVLIRRAVEKGAQAIVFSAIDANQCLEAINEAVDAGVYIVIIDSGINSDVASVEISTDNYAAGEMAATAVLENTSDKLEIGIVNFDVNTNNGQQRENGFKDKVLLDDRAEIVDIINVASNITSTVQGTEQMLAEYPNINVIVTFNEWTTLGVGNAIEDLGVSEQIQVVGFDNNTISIGMLETGEIDALIVQNPFAIGYLGIENAYNLIKKNNPPESFIYTETVLINRENMYDEDNQKLLFSVTSE